MRRTLALFAVIVLMASALAYRVTAAGLPAGDIVVAAQISSTDSGLIEINPLTGDRTILSDNTHGTGMPFTAAGIPQVMSNGDLLVADGGLPDQTAVYPDDLQPPPPPGSPSRLYIVDPTTGDRTVISQDAFTSKIAQYPTYPQIGLGPAFSSLGEARQVGNQIVAVAENFPFGQLMSVDPANGNRAIISGGNVGSGTQLLLPGGFLTSGNSAFEPSYQGLFKIDLTTGNRVLISGPSVGAGAPFVQGNDVAAFDGQFFVVGAGQLSDPSTYGVFRIDPITGNRSIVSNGTVGSGPLGADQFMAMAIESGGTILLSVNATDINGLLTVDPLTGNRAVLSDAMHGTGASFVAMYGVTVVPLVGDANGDGITNSQDLATISSQWTKSGYFLAGDLNGDGIVNTQDLALVSSNWLGASLTHGGAIGTPSAAVPEPNAILLAAIGCLALLRERAARN